MYRRSLRRAAFIHTNRCERECTHTHTRARVYVEASAKKSLRGERTLCVRVCTRWIYIASGTNYGISRVCVRTSVDTKRKYRADIILSTRRLGGVFVCGTPYRRDGSRRWWDGQTGEPARGIEENGSFPPHECVSLSPPTPSCIRFPLWYIRI